MNTARSRRTIVLALGLASLIVGACGGDDADSPTDTVGSAPTATESSTTPDPVSELCASLEDDLYGPRSAAVEAADSDTVAAAEDECDEALEALRAADDVQQVADTLRADSVNGQLAGGCTIGTNGGLLSRFQVSYAGDDPISVYGTVFVTRDGEPIPGAQSDQMFFEDVGEGPTHTPIEIQIPAAEAQPVDGLTCRASLHAFYGDWRSADAGLGEPYSPELASDDPAVWLAELFEIEHEWATSGDRDLVAVTEDIRSGRYTELVTELTPNPDAPDPAEIRPCWLNTWGSARQFSLVVVERPGDGGPELVLRAFQRGSDGGWRSLGAASHYARGVSCGDVERPDNSTPIGSG